MVKKVLSLHPSLAPRAFKVSPARPWWDVPDHKQKDLQTPWEEGTASAMGSFFHYSENSNTNDIFPAVSLHQGELFVLQAEGFLWNSTFSIRSPWQQDVTIVFSGHGSWVNKWPSAGLANSRTSQIEEKMNVLKISLQISVSCWNRAKIFNSYSDP